MGAVAGMRIEDYRFGHLCIDGQTYSADVLVHGDRVRSPWWRAKGHELAVSDLAELLDRPPRVLVIGTGCYGRMRVRPETLSALQARGIEVHALRTSEAVAGFNRLAAAGRDVAAALHLTC